MDTATDIKELEWIRRSMQGDHEAFRYLVLAYEPQLLVYLFRMLGNWENAYDIAQETFIAAFYALPRWKPLNQASAIASQNSGREVHLLAPWLYRIATNRALTLLKKQALHSSSTQLAGKEVPQSTQDVALRDQREQGMTMEERCVIRELLREALSHLSEEDAACLVLCFVVGERYVEIAARLGLTKEAVRKRISRGLIALRAAYHALDMENEL